MKLKFTHKTWYFFLLCAAAASMLNGFAVLGGMDFSFLEMVAFCITGITVRPADTDARLPEKGFSENVQHHGPSGGYGCAHRRCEIRVSQNTEVERWIN